MKMRKKFQWMFNFSASPEGGGLKRLIETAKWFDKNTEGGLFLIHPNCYQHVSIFKLKNEYVVIKNSKISRLFFEGNYLIKIISEYGEPEIYFSYGIPISKKIGNSINWLHISNALAISKNKFSIEFKRKIELFFLRKRFYECYNKYNIISAESSFCLDEFKKNISFQNKKNNFFILKNGVDEELHQTYEILKKSPNDSSSNYVITVGTWAYKRIDLVYKIFEQLQSKNPNLEKLIIVGSNSFLPKSIKNNPNVKIIDKINRTELYNLMYKANYYISASEIENSPNAVLEALFLSENIFISNIPAHKELVDGFDTNKIDIDHQEFLIVKGRKDLSSHDFISWDRVCKEMFFYASSIMNR